MHIRHFLAFMLDLVLPMHCIACGKTKTALCESCAMKIHSPDETPGGIIAAWDFKDPVARKAIHELKYRGRTGIAQVCGDALSDRLLEELGEQRVFGRFTAPLIVPIPLSGKRLRKRGFNQAELIAKHVSVALSLPSAFSPNVLKRLKDTPPQARIKDKRERLQNMRGVFAVPEKYAEALRGKDIILIDDVTTTGATLREAEKALRKAGARKVLLCAVAH